MVGQDFQKEADRHPVIPGVFCDMHDTLMLRDRTAERLADMRFRDDYTLNKDLWRRLCGLIDAGVPVTFITNGDIEAEQRALVKMMADELGPDLPKTWKRDADFISRRITFESKRQLQGRKVDILIDNVAEGAEGIYSVHHLNRESAWKAARIIERRKQTPSGGDADFKS